MFLNKVNNKMQFTIEPLKFSQVYFSGIQMPEIDCNVTMFMLISDEPIALNKLASLCDLTCNYSLITRHSSYCCYQSHGLENKFTLYSMNGVDYLSYEDYSQNKSINKLLDQYRHERVNFIAKAKNKLEGEFLLENGLYIIFTCVGNQYNVKFFDHTISTKDCYGKYIAELNIDRHYIKKEIWFAYHLKPSIMVKNAKKN